MTWRAAVQSGRGLLSLSVRSCNDSMAAVWITLSKASPNSIETTDGELVIRLANREVRIPWGRCSAVLAAATAEQRRRAELSPGGYGIHWPLLDEDLSVSGLVG